ncbi:MAG: DNA repair protein RecN [Spirochaetaceae bacterium]|nr:DNA repair protein RecN [Spirochaetaceae bacterium]
MLEELSVRDFALIDRLSVSLSGGLSILTGETGAGKSLLIGAIGFLLGGKADTGVIRAGAEEALVTGLVDVSASTEARSWLEARGIEAEEGKILVRRGLKSTGRGSIFIQNQPALRADLAELTGLLVDLHGQHEHQSLLASENHRRILDRYAGIEGEVAGFGQGFAELTAKRRSFESALASEKERAREIEFLRYAVDEIEKAKLKRGEEAELEAEERLLAEHEKLYAAVEQAHEALAHAGEQGAVLSSLRRGRTALEAAQGIDPALADLARRSDDAYYELEDVADSLRSYLGGLRYSPERLETIEARLAELHKLRKKYGGSVEDLLAKLEEDRERLARLETWEEDKEGLAAEIAELEAVVLKAALALSEKRKAAARTLETRIEAILRTLGMPKARFAVRVDRKEPEGGKPVVGQFGVDDIEFLIAPNPGEPAKPLARIASGGELSRVALAAKTVLAECDTVGTLVFDEIDSGIGGEVAVAVGEHLKALGKNRQVLCITHLASIAARADNHFRVEKEVAEGRTSTRLARMEGRPRAEEIARMLAGDPEEEASVAHATELLRKYGNWRDG